MYVECCIRKLNLSYRKKKLYKFIIIFKINLGDIWVLIDYKEYYFINYMGFKVLSKYRVDHTVD